MKLNLCSVFMALTLAASPLTAAAKSIAKEEVNVRSGPSLKEEIVLKAPLGYPVKVERSKGEWAYIRDWVNNRGWVHKALLSDIPTAVIMVKKANVRSGPGTDKEVVAEAGEGEIYRILERKGRWLKIGYYQGSESLGWVRSDMVFGE
ncbi:MAG: SH3 domain-containing protein [Syntrophobacteraceae bacterium]|nr:SH3 domain-containing protein [Syntrophobacteraceae bacterium]